MGTWAKIAVAIMVGGLVLGALGAMIQGYLYFSVYYRDSMGSDLLVSYYVCSFLGAITASAFTLFKLTKPPQVKAAGEACIIGAVLAFAWLFLSHKPFIGYNPNHGALADILLVHGVPYIWAIALLWQGRKLMLTKEGSLVGLTDEKNHEKRPTAVNN